MRRPHVIVLAERGPCRHRVTRSRLGTFAYGVALGLRTWIDLRPARVVTVHLASGHPGTAAWLARFEAGNPDAVRDELVAALDAMRAGSAEGV